MSCAHALRPIIGLPMGVATEVAQVDPRGPRLVRIRGEQRRPAIGAAQRIVGVVLPHRLIGMRHDGNVQLEARVPEHFERPEVALHGHVRRVEEVRVGIDAEDVAREALVNSFGLQEG